MTKTLSQMLGAAEPAFSLGIRQLEQASGGPAEDVRLSSEVVRIQRHALRLLSLDPDDTTARELYAALQQRVKEDSQIFEGLLDLHGGLSSGDRMAQVAAVCRLLSRQQLVFTIKPATAKRLLKHLPPKRTLKVLGYRSIDSVLKHEPVALLFAAAASSEPASWSKAMQASYRQLSPGDFEQRPLQIIAADGDRWQKLSELHTAKYRRNVIALRELGTVVILPAAHVALPAAPLAATLLVLQAVNDLRASSTYFKLHAVRPDFGHIVAQTTTQEPLTNASLGGKRLSWHLVHDYFARHPSAYNADLFEPHVQREDLSWRPVEDSLASLHPRFAFWQPAVFSGLLDKGELVSLNIVDAVLGFCNTLPFERRLVGYTRHRLWHELMVRYLCQDGIEQTVHEQLGRGLTAHPSLT